MRRRPRRKRSRRQTRPSAACARSGRLICRFDNACSGQAAEAPVQAEPDHIYIRTDVTGARAPDTGKEVGGVQMRVEIFGLSAQIWRDAVFDATSHRITAERLRIGPG